MKKLPRLATCALTLGLALAGAACSPGETSDSGGEEANEPVSLDPASFEGKTLDYVYFTDGPDEQATRDQVAAFEKETGAKVNLQIVPFDNLEQTLQARINSGEAPEVARTHDWRPYADVLVDFHRYFGDDYDSDFVEGMAKSSVDDGGALRAVPSDLTMNGPLVNVEAFEKAGVELPTADDPWTWPEMIEDARTVQKANGMEDAIAIDKSGHRLSTVLSQYGTAFFDEEGGVALDQAKAEEALGQLDELMQAGDISRDFWLEAGSRYEGANEIFLAGQVPIYISGNWQVGLLQETATFDWAAVPNPCQENCGGFPGGKYMVAFSESDEPDLAAYFVDWMNQPEQQKKLDQGASWLPTRNDLVDSGIQYPERSEDMAVFLADVPETPGSAYASFTHPSFTAAADLLIAEFDKTVAGQQDVATTVTNLRAELEKLGD